MSFALSICVLFTSIMQLVNGAQLLIIVFFILLGAAGVPALGMVIVLLASMCDHYKNINLTFAFKSFWLLVLYVPRELSFISTQFFVLNLDG